MTDKEALQIAYNALVEIDRQTPYPIAKHAIQAINKAFNEKSEQKPYCWVQSKLTQGMFYKEKPRRIHTIPLYTAPPEQGCGECGVKASDGYALYCVKCVEPFFRKEQT